MSMSARAAVLVGCALLAAACGGAPGPVRPNQGTPAPPAHGWPPPPAWPPRDPPPAGTPAATYVPYPYGNTFEDAGVNPYTDPLRDRLSTFSMDVDTASYDVGRGYLQDGSLPDRDSVRLEEYVNSFDYGYRAPAQDAFAIEVEGAPAPFIESRSVLLRVGIQARQVVDQVRPPLALTFVIDTSGSMGIENRLELVKESLALLVTRLRPNDSVAIVTFGTSAQVVLGATAAAEPETILAAIGGLRSEGSTNAQAGLELGYDLAARGHRPGVRDRVVLASDGVANVGLTDADSILARIDREVGSGVELISIGVGMGNFNDALLEQLADRGNGFYAYVNDRSQAEAVFGGRLIDALITVARDARVQVEFLPDAVARYRLLGYENRAMADQDFDNPAADAGEVGAGHSVTAIYEIEPGWSRGPLLGTVTLHWIDPDTQARKELARDITVSDFATDYYSATPSFRLAATVASFAEILRESPYVTGYTLADVDREAQDVARSFAGNAKVAEFSQLTSTAARFSPRISDW